MLRSRIIVFTFFLLSSFFLRIKFRKNSHQYIISSFFCLLTSDFKKIVDKFCSKSETQDIRRVAMYLYTALKEIRNSPASAAAAKSLQSCRTLCDPIDGSPPGSPIPGILLARTLEWVAISFSSAWKWKVKVKLLSRVRLFETPWTAAYQAPLSMGFFQARVLE